MIANKFVLFSAILNLLCIIPGSLVAQEELSPEQLFLLMKASSEQYDTFEAKIKSTIYQKIDGKVKTTLTEDIISRWTREKRFSKTISTTHLDETPTGPDYTPIIRTTCAITGHWRKRLIQAEDNRTPRGYVESGMFLKDPQECYTIYDAMWDLFAAPWDRIDIVKATATFNKDENNYVLNFKIRDVPKSHLFRLYIDPSRGFIPVKREYVKDDGTVMAKAECSDLRQTKGGLWIPYKYSWIAPRSKITNSSEVEEVKVNEPIADNLLDFAFPKGTIVHDEMRGLKYTVEGVDEGPADKAQAASETATDVTLTARVKEEHLRAAASKAEQMLETLTAEQAVPPAIQVWPTIVLVTNDKYEYKLSLAKSDGTKPVLLNYEFESGSLELSSLKNLIDDQNQLVLSINRKQSHSRFASGTLLLQLKGHDEVIKVTFVSPPLQDTP